MNAEDSRKRALNAKRHIEATLPLDVGLVPLYGPEIGPVVRCPWCGIVMITWDYPISTHDRVHPEHWKRGFMCPECGILG